MTADLRATAASVCRPGTQPVTLHCHPDSPRGAVRSIEVALSRSADGALTLFYLIEGDVDRLRIAAPAAAQFTHGLWRHTCCEAFIRCAGQPGYYEFNLAPSGEWAAYGFTAYREGAAPIEDLPAPAIAASRNAQTLRIDASIALQHLSPLWRCGALSIALSTVIEHHNGELSYWAIRHPAAKPDFHHPDAFALALPGPDPDRFPDFGPQTTG
jgi:hypothetical protein